MPLSLRHIEILAAIVRAGSVTGASKMLNLTQPAVSKALRHLEDSIGFPLFERRGNRLVPTPEGLRFGDEVDRAILQLDQIARVAGDLRTGRGNVSVGVSASLASSLLPRAVAVFRRSHPDVHLRLRTLNSNQIATWTEAGQLDVGVVIGDIGLWGVERTVIARASVQCLLPPDMAGVPDEIDAAWLEGRPLLSFRSETNSGHRVAGAFEAARVAYRPIIESASAPAAAALVAEGGLVALINPFSLGDDHADLLMRPFVPEITVEVRILTALGRRPSIPAVNMIRAFEKAANQRGRGAGGHPSNES